MKTIAIIGGGFSGTMAAVNLARLSGKSLRVVIINGRRPLGRGAAYGTSRSEHLLNVAARNMSALPDHPTHFVDWLRSRAEFSQVPDIDLREMFVSRKIYGDYVCGLLAACLHPIDPKSRVEVRAINDIAVGLSISEQRATITLEWGEAVTADAVLLATGNQPPASFACDSPLNFDRRYCADPWSDWQRHLPPATGHIVLLGSSLTAVDVIVTLAELNWGGHVTAISRSGLLPRPHFRGIVYPDFIAEHEGPLRLESLVQLVQQHCQKLERMSQNPAIAVDKLRPHTQRIWRELSLEDKRDFVARFATRWNSIRHRIAVPIHQRVTDALDAGRLEIVEGAIQSLAAREDRLDVRLKDPSGSERVVGADLVINCTGPQSRISRTESPLLQNVMQGGLVRPDELDMGIEVDDDFRVIGANGKTSNIIYAIGPLLKGSLWETVAVPELRVQAMGVAQTMLEQHHRTPREAVIEYLI
jgi:uncharacterized NAD(P)/FAD-binding protein YdhS